jgi:hypothetical protein
VPDVPKPIWWDELAARIAADPDWYAKYAAAEADRGNPYPLIGQILVALQHSAAPLSVDQVSAVRKAMETTASSQTKAELRRLERKLLALAVDRRVDDDGTKQEFAIDEVSKARNRSVRHIRKALADFGKRRR